MSGSPAFEVLPFDYNERYEVIVRYADRDLLQSGWLVGEETLAKKAGLIAAKYGEGRVVLIGFRAQHRAQNHGTFQLVHRPISPLEYRVRGKTGTGNQLPAAQLDPVPVLRGLDTRKHLSDDARVFNALIRWRWQESRIERTS
jgi:hypothetical protein